MAKRGPKTPEGIRAVTRNLPPPECSGPRTPRGKAVSSLNSLRHGLSSEGFLRCKGERCFYKESCPLLATEEGRSALKEISYGDPCPVELSLFGILREQATAELATVGVKDDTLAALIAMAEVQRNRAMAFAALEDGLVRKVAVDGTNGVRYTPALSFRYKQQQRSERAELLARFQAVKEHALSARRREEAEQEMAGAYLQHLGLGATDEERQ